MTMSTFMAIDGVGNWHKIHIGGKQSRMGLRTDDWVRVEWIEKGRYRMMTGMFEDEPIELTSTDPIAP
jgi:hypothetical protein